MMLRNLVSLLLVLGLLLPGQALMAQEEADQPPAPETDADMVAAVPIPPEEEVLTYEDYTVKGYTITAFGGQFSGATYLDNMPLESRTILTPEELAIRAYDGGILDVSLDAEHYTGAQKEIQPGPAAGLRLGIYISDDFHLDLLGTFSKGEVVTTMSFTEDPENYPESSERVEVDRDDGYQMYKGGLALMYDATPATFFGIVPRLGFGLGGIINRYSQLPDVTGLYLEGNFALNYEVIRNLQIGAQADLTNFAFEVEELGYSNMVNYVTFSLGITVFLDSLPPEVRAAHNAERNN